MLRDYLIDKQLLIAISLVPSDDELRKGQYTEENGDAVGTNRRDDDAQSGDVFGVLVAGT